MQYILNNETLSTCLVWAVAGLYLYGNYAFFRYMFKNAGKYGGVNGRNKQSCRCQQSRF